MTDEELDEPIWGAVNIGKAIKRKPRQALGLIHKKQLPVKKVGHSYTTTLRKLRQHFAENDA